MNLLWSIAQQAGWSSTEIVRATASKGRHLPRIDFIAEADAVPYAKPRLKWSGRRVEL